MYADRFEGSFIDRVAGPVQKPGVAEARLFLFSKGTAFEAVFPGFILEAGDLSKCSAALPRQEPVRTDAVFALIEKGNESSNQFLVPAGQSAFGHERLEEGGDA